MATMLSQHWSDFLGLFGGEKQLIHCISYMYLFWSVLILGVLQYISVPYGRYARKGWGFGIDSRVAWFLQELPSFAVPVMLMFMTNTPNISNLTNKIVLGMFLIHYAHRTFIFSLLIRGGKDSPFITFILAVIFCSMNGYIQGQYFLKYAEYSSGWMTSPNFVCGVVMFVLGMGINIHSDTVLRNLRKPGEKGYKIPRGGMFEYVSGANFLGEIIEWSGYALASGTLPSVAFAIMTAANIGPRACHHHRWYQQKFEDYPKKRKALLPFIL